MSPTSSNRLTTAIATWLLVLGIWGIASPVVFGIFSMNRPHAAIDLVLAVWGLRAAIGDRGAKGFLFGFGVIAVLVGVLYFVPGGRQWTDFLAVNRPGAIVDGVLGLVALACAARCWA